jgi:hypothetical protein
MNLKDAKLKLSVLKEWVTLLDEMLNNARNSCPCTHGVGQCQAACSCANPLMSGGCDFCCTYGSKEQQKVAAEQLLRIYRASRRMRQFVPAAENPELYHAHWELINALDGV